MRFRTRSSPLCRERWRYGISRSSSAKAASRSASASMQSIDDSRSRSSAGAPRRIARTSIPRRGASGRSPPHEVRSTPVSTTSRKPRAAKVLARSTTAASGAERAAPRPAGIAQKVQLWSQPFCTARNARVCSSTPSSSGLALSAFSKAGGGRSAHVSGLVFTALSTSRSTSGMAAKADGSIRAAQPVTTIARSGRSRFSLRIACRACRAASAVTPHVLTIARSPAPAARATREIASPSTRLSRQPKLTTSGIRSFKPTVTPPGRAGRRRASSRARTARGLP